MTNRDRITWKHRRPRKKRGSASYAEGIGLMVFIESRSDRGDKFLGPRRIIFNPGVEKETLHVWNLNLLPPVTNLCSTDEHQFFQQKYVLSFIIFWNQVA